MAALSWCAWRCPTRGGRKTTVALLLKETVAVALCLLVAGCSLGTGWRSAHHRDHPLVGSCWSVDAAAVVDCSEVKDAARGARLVLLGEQHDNPDHHRLQAAVLRGLVDAGRRPALLLEMLGPAVAEQAWAACRDRGRRGCTAAGLRRALDWDSSGWPDWQLYRPIFNVALERDLQLVGAGISRGEARGLSAPVDTPLDDKAVGELRREIIESHCGYASGHMVDAMVVIQQSRDSRMAAALAGALADENGAGEDGAVLIAGLGHTRLDRGVAWHLDSRARRQLLSLAFVEVIAGKRSPDDYAEHFDGRLPFDYLWFTPRADDLDPCERFEQQLKAMGKQP